MMMAIQAMEPSWSYYGLGEGSRVGSMCSAPGRSVRLLPSSAAAGLPVCSTLSQGSYHQNSWRIDKVHHPRIGTSQASHRSLRVALRDQAELSFSTPSSTPDLFLLDLASKLEDSIAGDDLQDDALSRLREESTEATLTCRWPTNKDEAYRFTDMRFLKKADIYPVDSTPDTAASVDLSSLNFSESDGNRLVFVDGVLSKALSQLEGLAEGLVVGSISNLPKEVIDNYVLPRLSGAVAKSQGDVFACLNGIGVRDLGVIIVPEGVKIADPLQIIYISTQRVPEQRQGEEPAFSLSNPRLLVIVEKDGELNFVEDFVGAPDAVYWTNSVCEIVIAEQGQVSHNFLQEENRKSVYIRQTFVSQAESSSYKLVEACFGGRLSRHNLHVQQLGPDTSTEFYSFLLSGRNQLHDLHSKLILSHPRGFSRQLHKCIVTDSSGHSVFDGNVKVNRYAQQTDAGQLSRSLLLAPRATVNVKPNLQIIANDVKCSHGAAISDLEEEQLFYFQARGIDTQTARSALVFSFGAEVVQKLGSQLKKRVESLVKDSLAAEGVIKRDISVSL
ncbi:unnamed protein product [Calypogeia fissa]